MGRNAISRHAVTRLNVYSCQAQKLSDSELPMRQVGWAEGMKLVKDEKAIWDYGRGGHIKGIRFIEKQRSQKPSACTLTMSVMKAVSGEGLAGPHSVDDHGLHGMEEGLRTKFAVWALVGDHKAVAVRPKVDAAYVEMAQKLLGLKAA